MLVLTPLPLASDDVLSRAYHIETRCQADHEVHIYYKRRFTAPPDV